MSLKVLISLTATQWINLLVILRLLIFAVLNNQYNRIINNIRPFTLGRRNWLFNNTADGAEASAIMFSVIRTAIANNLDPYWYLRYLLDNLLNLKTKEDFSAFMPQNVTKEQLISYKEQILAYENSLMARI